MPPDAPSPAVLRNRGVPVAVAAVQPDETGEWAPVTVFVDGEERVQEVERHIRFTNNTFADMEDRWGSLDEYQKLAADKPRSMLRAVLALAWGLPERQVGAMLLDGREGVYIAAIGAAIAVANGVDPQTAAAMMRTAIDAVTKLNQLKTKAADALVVDHDDQSATLWAQGMDILAEMQRLVEGSRGSNGSEDGSGSVSAPTTSGS